MAAQSEALAAQVESRVEDTVALLERLSDADWTKVTEAERWTVGVTAHHLASVLEPVAGIVATIAAGQAPGPLTRAMLDELNARHAREHAGCTRAETIALLRRGATTALAVVRGLTDEQLARRASVFSEAPPMSAEQMIVGALVQHIDEHVGSIRRTVGDAAPAGRAPRVSSTRRAPSRRPSSSPRSRQVAPRSRPRARGLHGT
jgi:hypothetical protein